MTYSDYMSARHQKRTHLAYFDGHVELLDAVRWNNYKAGNVSDPYIFYESLVGGTPPVLKPRP